MNELREEVDMLKLQLLERDSRESALREELNNALALLETSRRDVESSLSTISDMASKRDAVEEALQV